MTSWDVAPGLSRASDTAAYASTDTSSRALYFSPCPGMKQRLSVLAALPHISTGRNARRHLFTQLSRHAWLRLGPRQSLQLRRLATTSSWKRDGNQGSDYEHSNARPANDLNNNITQEEKDHFAKKLREDKGKQIRTPWHREGSNVPPVHRQRSASAMTKGE